MASLGVLLGSTLSALVTAQEETFSDLEVRAVFLYNFAAFVHWPETAFESPTAAIRYCLLSGKALEENLKEAIEGEVVDGHPLTLISPLTSREWSSCHVLYIDHNFRGAGEGVLDATQGSPVLTVGDSEAFARHGGMIGLERRGARLRTYINRTAAADAGIRISSKLLRIANLVAETE